MMTYETYKESGIEWIGNEKRIPDYWHVERVKDQGEFRSGDYISALNLDIINTYPVYGGNGLRGFASNYNHDGNYILIGRQGALCGNINYTSGKFWATEHAVVVYKKKNANFYWLGELLRAMNLNQYSLSAAQPGLSVDRIKRLEIPVPPLPEQKSIAQYLDTKTQAIDKKVKLLEQKIGYYKELRKSLINDAVTKGLDKTVRLKESGIDWVGQIPEHWEVQRFKDSFKLKTGNSISDKGAFEVKENAHFYVSTKDIDIDSGTINYDNGIFVPKGDKTFKRAKSHSTLICIEGANAGKKIGFTDKEICFVNKLCSIKGKKKTVHDKYNFYFMNSKAFDNQFTSLISGLIGGVSINQIKFFHVLLPPTEEQIEIADYLDQKTETIDKIVKNILEQIDRLKELRKTLINDVVTGKIRVYEKELKETVV